jgi:putative PIN family toxin of toxin-antitoxin system
VKLRVVIDTNVVISGLLWGGLPNGILKLARDGIIEVCSTKTICEELAKVLEYPRFEKRLAELSLTKEDAVDYYEDIVTLYKENASIEVVKNDPNDDRFIEAALDSGCSIIISGDEHLLEMKEYQGIMMLSPREFWEVYERIQK